MRHSTDSTNCTLSVLSETFWWNFGGAKTFSKQLLLAASGVHAGNALHLGKSWPHSKATAITLEAEPAYRVVAFQIGSRTDRPAGRLTARMRDSCVSRPRPPPSGSNLSVDSSLGRTVLVHWTASKRLSSGCRDEETPTHVPRRSRGVTGASKAPEITELAAVDTRLQAG